MPCGFPQMYYITRNLAIQVQYSAISLEIQYVKMLTFNQSSYVILDVICHRCYMSRMLYVFLDAMSLMLYFLDVI